MDSCKQWLINFKMLFYSHVLLILKMYLIIINVMINNFSFFSYLAVSNFLKQWFSYVINYYYKRSGYWGHKAIYKALDSGRRNQ